MKKKNREIFSWFGFIAKITSYERTFTIEENNLLTKLYKKEYINYFSNVIIVYRIYCIKGKFSKIKLLKFYIRFTLFQEERLINLPYYHLKKEFKSIMRVHAAAKFVPAFNVHTINSNLSGNQKPKKVGPTYCWKLLQVRSIE